MDKTLFNVLNDLGVSHNLKGRAFIETAIRIVMGKGNISITKELYPTVAKEHGTTSVSAERAIRHAIESGLINTDEKAIQKYFGNTISVQSGKMTNSAFIYGVAKYLEVFAQK